MEDFLPWKVAENSPQNAQNCTIFKNFLGGGGGGMPPNPPSKGSQLRVYPKSQKFKVGPPLGNPAYAPVYSTGACPGICKGGGAENLKAFFLLFNISRGGAAQKIADIMTFPTKKVAKYR